MTIPPMPATPGTVQQWVDAVKPSVSNWADTWRTATGRRIQLIDIRIDAGQVVLAIDEGRHPESPGYVGTVPTSIGALVARTERGAAKLAHDPLGRLAADCAVFYYDAASVWMNRYTYF